MVEIIDNLSPELYLNVLNIGGPPPASGTQIGAAERPGR